MKTNQKIQMLLESSLEDVKGLFDYEEGREATRDNLSLAGAFSEILREEHISKRNALILRDFYMGRLVGFMTAPKKNLRDAELTALYKIKEESEYVLSLLSEEFKI